MVDMAEVPEVELPENLPPELKELLGESWKTSHLL